MTPKNQDDSLWVISRVAETTYAPQVEVIYKENSATLESKDAAEYAIAIMNATAYAESEVALFQSLTTDKPTKGFGGQPKISKDYQMALQVMELVRSKRQPLPTGVNGIFGFENQRALVDVDYGTFRQQFELDEARHHAKLLLEASEAALFDSFWLQFGQSELGLSEQEARAITSGYGQYRLEYLGLK